MLGRTRTNGNFTITSGVVTISNNAELIVEGNTEIKGYNAHVYNHGVFETNNFTLMYAAINGGGTGYYHQNDASAKLIINGNSSFNGTSYSDITNGIVVFDGTEQQTVGHLKAYNIEVLNLNGIKYLSNIHVYGNYNLHGNPLDNANYDTYLYENATLTKGSDYGDLYMAARMDAAV